MPSRSMATSIRGTSASDSNDDPNSSNDLPNDRINCAAGDLGPEGILFIPPLLSPNFRPLLVVNYETSGSTRIWQIDRAGQ